MKIRYIFLTLFFVQIGLIGICTGQPSEKAQSPQQKEIDKIVDKMQKFYDDAKDYQADFTQIYHNLALGTDQTRNGHVYFKKSGKMRWDYREPDEKYLISNGKTLWVWEPQFNQFFKQSLKDSQLPVSLRFLMGEGDIREEFEVKLAADSPEDSLTLELVPLKDQSMYTKLVFVIDNKTFEVRETVMHDPMHNTNRIIFSEALVNKGLPDSGFDFTPPDGATELSPK